MIDQATIDRVDRWHSQLDFMAQGMCSADNHVTLASGESASITEDAREAGWTPPRGESE